MKTEIVSGNEAAALGALAAGCKFFAGYPITPSSNILYEMAKRLPDQGGVFYQAEDELAAIGMVISASAGGQKSMTATSGPGLSLMQEELGWAIINEIPLVVIDAMRIGPSTGQPTKPASADINCLIKGRHGDSGDCVIVLTPSSVQECFNLTVTAFQLAEEFRTPVFVAIDGYLSGLYERLEISENIQIIDRARDGIIGKGEGIAYGGVMHNRLGKRYSFSPDVCKETIGHLIQKRNEMPTIYNIEQIFDCDYLIISYGFASRATRDAANQLRKQGLKIGLLELKTIWPLDRISSTELNRVKKIIVVENNAGQLIDLLNLPKDKVVAFNKWWGEPIETRELLDFLDEIITGTKTKQEVATEKPLIQKEKDDCLDIQIDADYPFCAGCGHKVFRSNLLPILKERGLTKENTILASGIGCGGIVATTLNADVIKTSHGRTLNAARALRLIYTEKMIVVISGDGDLINIGGNALIHTAREKDRFPMLCICLDNVNYGMTGGQLSATTPEWGKTSVPFTQKPFNLKQLLYDGCGIDFFARTAVPCRDHLKKTIERAIDFVRNKKSFAFVHALSPCVTHFTKRNPGHFTKNKLQQYCEIWERNNEPQNCN